MIPLRDENPSRTVPYVMYVIVALNILAFLIDYAGQRVIPPGVQIGGLWDYTMVPAQIQHWDPSISVKLLVSPNSYVVIPHPSPSPVWLTVFTSMFLHGNWFHLGSNMLFLWIFGNNIEDVLGHGKFLIFYLAGGVVAALAHVFSDPGSLVPVLGASGAIAAVLGAYLVLFPNARVLTLIFLGFFVTTVALPAVVLLGYWILIQILNATLLGGGATPGAGGVAYWAHIGGFAAGALGILLLGGRRLVRDRREDRSFYHSWYED